jgi:hypothetical protein
MASKLEYLAEHGAKATGPLSVITQLNYCFNFFPKLSNHPVCVTTIGLELSSVGPVLDISTASSCHVPGGGLGPLLRFGFTTDVELISELGGGGVERAIC